MTGIFTDFSPWKESALGIRGSRFLENSKQYKNAGRRFRVYGALVDNYLNRIHTKLQ